MEENMNAGLKESLDLTKLKDPFPSEKISWRVGATNKEKTKGLALAYIDARDAMERLDNVCGVEGWQRKHPHANGKTTCAIGIKIDAEWIWKEDGAGDTQTEAEKGALSDSFKRAGAVWGIGRYLYDMPSIWVEIEPYGKSHKIKDSEIPKLINAHDVLIGKKPEQKKSNEQKPAADWLSDARGKLSSLKTPEEINKWLKDNPAPKLSADQEKWFNDLKARNLARVSQAPLKVAAE